MVISVKLWQYCWYKYCFWKFVKTKTIVRFWNLNKYLHNSTHSTSTNLCAIHAHCFVWNLSPSYVKCRCVQYSLLNASMLIIKHFQAHFFANLCVNMLNALLGLSVLVMSIVCECGFFNEIQICLIIKLGVFSLC